MATPLTVRKNFARIQKVLEYPDFLSVQVQSFKDFFQLDTPAERRENEGLYKVFMENFPISDSRENFVLEFIDYTVDPPKYSVDECIDRGLTYSIPLKAKLRLSCNDEDNEDFETIEQEVFLGNIPYMTAKGSFVINGAERVIVSQLHRSPGVFFAQSKHTNGTKLYSARIIPFKGSWIEFATDVNNVMYAYIDRKKKFPVTTLLRAIGYGTDKDILDLFGLSEEVPATKAALGKIVGRKLAARVLRTWTEDFVDEDTGEVVSIDRNEVLLERDSVITDEDIPTIVDCGAKSIILHREDVNVTDYTIIYNTLQKDNSNSEKEAVEQIYRQLRNTEAPDEQTARDIIQSLFFSDKRYDLGEVGRYRINKKLNLNITSDIRVLTTEDIIHIVKYLIGLINSRAVVDDIDHLSNRRVRTVGEQLYSQFGVGLARMARTIKERMNVRDNEDFKPVDLINARTLSSVINSFFGTNQLSQFMDQTNPLAEVTHKRRMSALGPGGLSRERAGFEVRDVHYTHYGRLCTIETPEGPNIGLISSLCVHAKVNNMGFIETPYRKVENGTVMSKDIIYLTAEEEDTHNIAQANAPIDEAGEFLNDKVKARFEGDFPVLDPKELSYMDIAPNQIVSVAASLIPFLEHDDANRALMGSNMQRQAVPLLRPDAPIVGTGLEGRVAMDSRSLVIAEGNGVVDFVDATKIVIKYDRNEEQELVSFDDEKKPYHLVKFRRTNQDTTINLRPIVLKGQRVEKGQPLCQGYSTEKGELALGRNMLVAFMPWQGYNFEDAIVISERVVKDDIFTSIHIEEFELEVRDTKRGEEELTSEIPNVSEEAVKHLDENGIVRVGAEIREGDILIGKITPKGETDPTPEEKLLRAIFGDKAGDVKDASMKASPSLRGVVIDTKLFSRPKKDKDLRAKAKREVEELKAKYGADLTKVRNRMIDKLSVLLDGKISEGVKHKFGDEIITKGVKFIRKNIEENIFPANNIYRDESNYNVPEEVNSFTCSSSVQFSRFRSVIKF
ncbi:MAG: DNA-directed RNA polymerase subunit beta, partial [Bacteroidota bacterium]